jgi:putative transposase
MIPTHKTAQARSSNRALHRTLRQLNPHQAETAAPEVINLAGYRLRRRPVLGGLTSEYRIAA